MRTVHICIYIYIITGVPAMVPSVIVDDNTININGNNVILTLSWGEPFNNLDPIESYTVSCSGDDTCPPNFTTIDNTARNYTITNLTPMTNYTFSVVATNSIGSGEAGVVMITTPAGESTTTSNMDMAITSSVGITTSTSTTTTTTTSTTTSSVGMTTITTTTSSVGMTTTSSVGMTTTSSVGMTTTTSSVGMTTTTSTYNHAHHAYSCSSISSSCSSRSRSRYLSCKHVAVYIHTYLHAYYTYMATKIKF